MTQAHTALILTLLLWGTAGEPEARGQTAGTFTATGSMITPRSLYTATLLPGGKVLFAGGQGADYRTILASAELYDPSIGVFIPTGNMSTARAGHSATLLPDGRVLIAGGSNGFSAEVHDPASVTFTATGGMLSSVNGTAVLLANGKVLIAHDRSPYAATATAELYDSIPGRFSATGNQLLIWAGDQKAACLPTGGSYSCIAVPQNNSMTLQAASSVLRAL